MKHSPEFDNLFRAILTLETEDECYKLFEDICTVKELEAIAQRLEVAAQLSSGKNYNAVSEITGASSATISRVNKCLLYGQGGYEMVLARMEEEACC